MLLKFRLRSEKELCQRLERKKFRPDIIEKTIAFLKEKGFVNDNEFAGMWISSRLKRPLGLIRLKRELSLKGIDNGIIEAQIDRFRQGYREEAIVLKIAEERIPRLKGIEPRKRKARLFNYLLRRGFSPEVITGVMEKLIE